MSETSVGAGRKVLVVDDSKTIRRTTETLLKPLGFSVITAEDGMDAFRKIVAQKPDIIFMDVTMPRLDGYMACALIKSNQRYKPVPIVLLTSLDGLFDRAKGRIVGADKYLCKPFTKADLMGAINDCLISNENFDNEEEAIDDTCFSGR